MGALSVPGTRPIIKEAMKAMTVREHFIKRLGKKKFAKLPKLWKDHVRRMDSLPKPIRKAPPQTSESA